MECEKNPTRLFARSSNLGIGILTVKAEFSRRYTATTPSDEPWL